MATRKAAQSKAPAPAPAPANQGRQQQQQRQNLAPVGNGAITLSKEQQQTLTANWNLMSSLTAANAAILSSIGLPLAGNDTGV